MQIMEFILGIGVVFMILSSIGIAVWLIEKIENRVKKTTRTYHIKWNNKQ